MPNYGRRFAIKRLGVQIPVPWYTSWIDLQHGSIRSLLSSIIYYMAHSNLNQVLKGGLGGMRSLRSISDLEYSQKCYKTGLFYLNAKK